MYNRHTQVNQLAEIGEGSPTVKQSGTQPEASTVPPTLKRRTYGIFHAASFTNKDREVVDTNQT